MLPNRRQTALLTLLGILLILTVISMVGLYLMTQSNMMDGLFARIFRGGGG
ncbi:MAG: hypothetical protein ABIQ54_01255 [Gammaproteobacteria bacterium]